MNKYNIAVIRVVTLEDEHILNIHGKLIEKYYPNLNTKTFCIENQYKGIYDDKSHNEAVPKIIKLVKAIYKDFDGVIISCAGDPAVKQLKKDLNIPVIGAGECLSSLSIIYGNKIGVIGIGENTPKSIKEILENKIVKYIQPKNIKNTTDIHKEGGMEAIKNACKEIESVGADVIILGCSGLSTAGVFKHLSKNLLIPVIDPVFAEATIMFALCNKKLY